MDHFPFVKLETNIKKVKDKCKYLTTDLYVELCEWASLLILSILTGQVMSDSSVIRHAEENIENTSFSLLKKESKFLKKFSRS